jgi:hypothetical protein
VVGDGQELAQKMLGSIMTLHSATFTLSFRVRHGQSAFTGADR